MDQSAQPTTAPSQAPSTAAADTSNTKAKTTVGTSGRGRRLPKTASELPMVGLIGMLSALGFSMLRYGRSLRN